MQYREVKWSHGQLLKMDEAALTAAFQWRIDWIIRIDYAWQSEPGLALQNVVVRTRLGLGIVVVFAVDVLQQENALLLLIIYT